MSKTSVLINLLQMLLAILLGNLVYFLLLPHLPPAARHHPFQLDLGNDAGFLVLPGDLWPDPHASVSGNSRKRLGVNPQRPGYFRNLGPGTPGR